MHGILLWYGGIAIPVVFGSLWYMGRYRLAYSWRANACDMDHIIYPMPTMKDLHNIRKVQGHDCEEITDGTSIHKMNTPGLVNRTGFLTQDEVDVMLELVREYVKEWGVPLDSRVQEGWTQQLSEAGMDTTCIQDIRTVSGIVESNHEIKTIWGSGDKMKLEELPQGVRHLAARAQLAFPHIGRFRNVSITYAPAGTVVRQPKAPVRWAGNDYIIVPLLPSRNEEERIHRRKTVLTFSPLLRSGQNILENVMKDSWTSQDIDVLAESGAAVRVYGKARFQWGWGVRPGEQWFGHSRNVVDREVVSAVVATTKSWFGSSNSVAPPPKNSTTTDCAFLTLSFEGPFGLEQARRPTRLPESVAFGAPPSTEDFQTWTGDMPDEAEIHQEGFWWFVKNFKEFYRY